MVFLREFFFGVVGGLEFHFSFGAEGNAAAGCRICERHFFYMGMVSVFLWHDVGNIFLGHAGCETSDFCMMAKILIVFSRSHAVVFHFFHSRGKGKFVTESRKPDRLGMHFGMNGNVKFRIAMIQAGNDLIMKKRTSGNTGQASFAEEFNSFFCFFPGEGIAFIKEAVHIPAA